MSEDAETLSWTVRLSDERPGSVPAIFGVALLAFLLGTFGLGQPLLGLIGAMMVLGTTADYWLGSRFTLDALGATAKTGLSMTTMEWIDVRRVLIEGRKVRLSPLENASRLDAFRGVGLVTTGDNHARVLEFVRSHVPEESR